MFLPYPSLTRANPVTRAVTQPNPAKTKGKLPVVLDESELHWRTLSSSPSMRNKGTLSRALLWSPSLPNITLSEFTIPRRPIELDLVKKSSP
jgi:hypothetical protein